MVIRIVLWNLADSKTTIGELRRYLRDESVAAFEQVPGLVLLDLMLPGLDGYEVARRLKTDPRTQQVPIIAITALARPMKQPFLRPVGELEAFMR